MALTNQPYLPLYVDDWMNNNKLKMCSPAAHGIMISIMCVMHKEVEYGKILLKQKFKQSNEQIKNFALQVAKLSAFEMSEVEAPLLELLHEKVLEIQGEYLVCPRMVRDCEISLKRANAGRNGGNSNKDKNFAYTKPEANNRTTTEAKPEANAVNGIVNGNESEIGKGKEGSGEKPKRNSEPKPAAILPFDTELFKSQWQLWKVFRAKEHKFHYKTDISEQAALKELNNLASGDEKNAIAIIHQSMAKGWKGFFELKNTSNGQQQSNSGSTRQQYSDEFQRKIAEGLQS